MTRSVAVALAALLAACAAPPGPAPGGERPAPLFDGRTFEGWEGDTLSTWRTSAALRHLQLRELSREGDAP